jgi:hypothetical protein
MRDAPQLGFRGLALAREIDGAPFLGAQRLQRRLGVALDLDPILQVRDLFDRGLGILEGGRGGLLGLLAAIALDLGLPDLVQELAHGHHPCANG